ncbi:hypothetical protein V4C53_35185 [Paraburkholderia azotifigens]|uniref:hypothetical protein n=1 Tax=Paraburkholderia azotifigens TaxID=2057004 RepID=UPI0031732014
MLSRPRLFLIGLSCIFLFGQVAQAQMLPHHADRDLRVMTYNAYQGTDLVEVAKASTTQEFLVAVGDTIAQVRKTKPPQRMRALAREIVASGAALVSVQELNEWSTGTFDPSTATCGAMTTEFDMLRDLRNALLATGGHYVVASQATEYAFPPTPGLISPSQFLCVGLTNHVAIFVRTDRPSRLQWSNPQSAQYKSMYAPSTAIGAVPFPRAWMSIDVRFEGRAFRFIGTHLESSDGNVRERQGSELRDGPAKTQLPVIVAMDSNAQAAPAPIDPTYADFQRTGFLDAWAVTHPSLPGFTCCQNQLVNNHASELFQRIDLILTRGAVDVKDADIVGVSQDSKTPDGLWPSDHAGVTARVDLQYPAWMNNPFGHRKDSDNFAPPFVVH